MEIVVSAILIILLGLSIYFRVKNKKNYYDLQEKEKSKYSNRRLLSLVLIIVPLSIMSVISLIPGMTNEVFDRMELPITNDRLWVPQSNIYSEDPVDEFVVFEYRTYNEWFNGFRRYFKVKNHENFMDFLSKTDYTVTQYSLDEFTTVFLLKDQEQFFYLVYNEVESQYYISSMTLYFNSNSESDNIPVIPSDYLLNDENNLVGSSLTVTTPLAWNEVIDYYNHLSVEHITINQADKTIELYNPMSNNTYLVTYDDYLVSYVLVE